MDINVYNESLVRIGILDIYESFIWTERYNSIGDFEIVTSASVEYLDLLRENYFLRIASSNKAMIIESIQIKTDIENGNRLIVKGRSLESILERRITLQVTRFSTTSIQTAIQTLLNENAISSSQSHRDFTRLVFQSSSDPLVTTPTITAEYYRQLILEIIEYIAKKNEIGYKITINSSNQFVFSLYAGVDRSFAQSTNSYVIFSRSFDNLIQSDYFRSIKYLKTYTLVMGGPSGGVGADLPHSKEVLQPEGRGEDMTLRESSIDAYDISKFKPDGTEKVVATHLEELKERGKDFLRDSREVVAFDAKVYSNINFKYGIDYFLGDIVQTVDEYGNEGRSRVVEIITSSDITGDYIYPTFEII